MKDLSSLPDEKGPFDCVQVLPKEILGFDLLDVAYWRSEASWVRQCVCGRGRGLPNEDYVLESMSSYLAVVEH